MILRNALLAVVLCCRAVAPAAAQENAGADTRAMPAPEAVAAGRDLYQAMVFDSGVVNIFDAVSAQMMPQMRTSMTTSPLFRNARREHREALTAFLETMPTLVREEFMACLLDVGDRIGPRFATVMSAEDLTATAGFMRSPEVAVIWRTVIEAYALPDAKAPPLDFSWNENRSPEVVAFITSPAGQAFMREETRLTAILQEEMSAALVRAQPRIERRILAGTCDALDDECPATIRTTLGRI